MSKIVEGSTGWKKLICDRYSDQFENLFSILDKQLTDRVAERSSRDFYAECLFYAELDKNAQTVDFPLYLFKAIQSIYGHEVATKKFMINNLPIANTIYDLITLFEDIKAMWEKYYDQLINLN